jgi:hypothetical protein
MRKDRKAEKYSKTKGNRVNHESFKLQPQGSQSFNNIISQKVSTTDWPT